MEGFRYWLSRIVVGGSLAGLMFWLLYTVIASWQAESTQVSIYFIKEPYIDFQLDSYDRYVLNLLVFMGAIGGTLHALLSFSIHCGKESLTQHWFPFYLLKPFVGAGMALAVYLVFRGALFSKGAEDINLFGFAGLTILAGLFAELPLRNLKMCLIVCLRQKIRIKMQAKHNYYY